MPPFPERESSILAKLKKKKGPGNVTGVDDTRRNVNGAAEHADGENGGEADATAVMPESRARFAFAFLLTPSCFFCFLFVVVLPPSVLSSTDDGASRQQAAARPLYSHRVRCRHHGILAP